MDDRLSLCQERRKMIKKRYADAERLVTDTKELEITDAGEVLIYRGDKWYGEVSVCLEGKEEEFEELKPAIAYAAENLYKMDQIAQRYSALHGDSRFASGYEAAYICFGAPGEIRVRYYGMQENTEFDVVFWRAGGGFLLKSFGMRKNIPPGWDRG